MIGGRIHKEIFSLPVVKSGPLLNQEWAKIVKPVIHRWGEFVKEFVE
jgi:hypothetical protein